MKKFLSILLMMTLVLGGLSAVVVLPGDSMSVAAAGKYADVFANPAALSFRSRSEGNFLLSVNYQDRQDPGLYARKEPLSFFNESGLGLTLSFGGQHAMLTAGFAYGLDDRTYSEGILTFDMLFRMHFQLDLAYSIGPFSVGARLQGGSDMRRSDREVDDTWDIFANWLLAEYDEYLGSEYFSLGIGMMWYEDFFSVGVYSDQVIGTDSGEVTFSGWDVLDNLSVGLSFYMPRYTRAGELVFVRPVLNLQAGDVSSTQSYLMAELELVFQLLPDVDIVASTSVISYRDARTDYWRSTGNVHSYGLNLDFATWGARLDVQVPFEYYTGDSSQPFLVRLSMRYCP